MNAAKLISPLVGGVSLLKKKSGDGGGGAAPMDTAGTPFGVKRRRPGAAALVEQGYGPGSMPTYQP